ncbi:MAG: FliM/FliN family flagellar motor C-terminal domain-containing protein, partial [Phycisphaerales bacterium]
MPLPDLAAALRLEVPVIVRLGERVMTVGEVIGLAPGAIIELPKTSEAELDLLVNNKQIGTGTAVKEG